MAIVKHLPPDGLPPAAADVYRRYAQGRTGFRRNQAAVFAHVPDALEHLLELPMILKARQSLPQRFVELAIVVVSSVNESNVCVVHHLPNMKSEGCDERTVAAALDASPAAGMDDVDRLVIEYATAVSLTPNDIPEALLRNLRVHFSESQLVELTLRIALCGFFNRFNDALQITDDP
jgi:alkylhydroperoxidase family enzyme